MRQAWKIHRSIIPALAQHGSGDVRTSNLRPSQIWVRDRVVVGHSPRVGIRLPALETKRITPLDVRTVMALADAVPDRAMAHRCPGRPGTGRQGTGPHVCRHTYAAALIRYGEGVKTVQHLLGHSSAVTTLNIYAHLWPDADDQARAAACADVPIPMDCR